MENSPNSTSTPARSVSTCLVQAHTKSAPSVPFTPITRTPTTPTTSIPPAPTSSTPSGTVSCLMSIKPVTSSQDDSGIGIYGSAASWRLCFELLQYKISDALGNILSFFWPFQLVPVPVPNYNLEMALPTAADSFSESNQNHTALPSGNTQLSSGHEGHCHLFSTTDGVNARSSGDQPQKPSPPNNQKDLTSMPGSDPIPTLPKSDQKASGNKGESSQNPTGVTSRSTSQFLASLKISNSAAEMELCKQGYDSEENLLRTPPNVEQLKLYGFNDFQCNTIVRALHAPTTKPEITHMQPIQTLITVSKPSQSPKDLWSKENLTFVEKFVDRENAIKNLIDYCNFNVNSFKEKKTANQSWILPTIFGTSGIGKTRLSFEAVVPLQKSLRETFGGEVSFIDVFYKMVNGAKPSVEHVRNPAELVASLLASHCLQKTPGTISSILDRKKKGTHLDLGNVVENIRKLYNVSANHVLVIFLRVDEIQMLLDDGTFATFIKEVIQQKYNPEEKEDARHASLLYLFSKAIMECVINAATTLNTFIFPIFSGTFPLEHISLFPKSLYIVKSVFLRPLSIESALQLLEKQPSKIDVRSTQFELFLQMVGPIPRVLQNLVVPQFDKVVPLRDLDSLVTIYERARIKTFPLTTQTAEKLLFYGFTQREYSFDYPPINTLILDGLISISENNILQIPFMVFDTIRRRGEKTWPFLDEYFKFTSYVTPEAAEKFVPQFYCFRQNLYLMNGIKSVSFSEFFHGAYMHESLGNQILYLGEEPMEFYSSVHIEPKDLTSVAVHGVPNKTIDVSQTIAGVWFGKRYEIGDWHLYFPNCIATGESKVTTTPQGRASLSGDSDSTFKMEQEKAFRQQSNKFQVFLFVTNAKMTENGASDIVHPNSMFINQARWKMAFCNWFWFFTQEHQPKV